VDEPDLKGYAIFRGVSRTSMVRLTPAPLPPTPKPAWVDTGYLGNGLPAGKTLVYAVAAIDTSLNEGTPAFVEVPIPDNVPPSPAFALTARSTREGRVSLSWQPSQSRNLASHRVQRKADGPYAGMADLPADTTKWEDPSAAGGVTYTYRVLEVSRAGLESAPSPEARITVTSSIPPGPPAGLAAELTPRGVSLSWRAPASAGVTGYLIYRAPYQGAQYSRISAAPVKDTEWVDTKGQKENAYAVSAIDASANESTRVYAGVKDSPKQQ
jgi:fibronectin type 3 domain-containing protein